MTARVSEKPFCRLMACMLGQVMKTRVCPDIPLLTDKIVLITGATSGIGKETARGLLRRGAEIIMLCRNMDKADVVVQEFIVDGLDARRVHIVACDLSQRDSILSATDTVYSILSGRQIDVLIENAGVMLNNYDTTNDGVELTFATNVLGHFILRQGLVPQAMNPHGRLIILTGDIYIMASACDPNFKWRGILGGVRAYNRSKLGNFWIAREFQRRHPQLNVFTVHPGVVATALGGTNGLLTRWFKRRFFLNAQMGAQTTLICASQNDLSHGSYYHNVHGEVELNNADPAMNDVAAARLYETCEQIANRDDVRSAPVRFAS